MKSLKTLLIAGAAVAATTLSAGAMAMTPWERAHYYRHEHRMVRHEDHRINRALEHGRITPHEARVLHYQNHNRY